MSHPLVGRVRGVTYGVSVLLADNPGPMTLDGTNSYLLSEPDSVSLVVVDPGPLDEEHLQSLAGEGPVELVLITHRHADHTAGARRFAEITGAPVRAADPEQCVGGTPVGRWRADRGGRAADPGAGHPWSTPATRFPSTCPNPTGQGPC